MIPLLHGRWTVHPATHALVCVKIIVLLCQALEKYLTTLGKEICRIGHINVVHTRNDTANHISM